MKDLNRWVYAAAGVCVLSFAGMIYAWSVFSVPIGNEFSVWTKTQLSMTFTAAMIFFCLGGLLGGILAGAVNVKVNIVASGILFWAGFWLTAQTQAPWQLYTGFGVMGGLASGLTYNAVMSTMSKRFPDKQGLISGILLMGFGLGSFLIGKAFQMYTPTDPGGWRVSFKFFGALLFALMAIGSVFFEKPSESGIDGEKKAFPDGIFSEKNAGLPPVQVLRHSSFWISYGWAVLAGAAGLVLVSQASGIVLEVNPLTEGEMVPVLVGLISVFNGVGRVVFGFLYDAKGYRFAMTFDVLFSLIAAATLFGAITAGQFLLIPLGFVLGGLAFGGVPTCVSALIGDFYGVKYYPVNYSIACTNLIFASFGSAAAGGLYDFTGSYVSAMLMAGSAAILSGFCLLGIRRPEKMGALQG
jgi:OFA family oxalate/formate antiporter-like MFS transporter